MHIRDFEQNDISEVRHIFALQFGEGFINNSTLERFVYERSTNGLVAVNNNIILGVLITHTLSVNEIKNELNFEIAEIHESLPNQARIGIINSFAILPDYTGKGIGSALIKERMNWFRENCDAIICMCWVESNGGMEKLLIKNEFNYKMTISDYWKNNSLQENFTCKRCGAPPCLCTGKLFIKIF